MCQSPSELGELKRAPTLPHIQPAPPPSASCLLPQRLTSCSLMFPLRLLCMHMIMWVIVYVGVLIVCETSLTCPVCIQGVSSFMNT